MPQLLLPMKTLFLIFIVSEIFPPFVICWVFTWHQIPNFFFFLPCYDDFFLQIFYNVPWFSLIKSQQICWWILDRSVRKSRLVCWETVIRARLPTDAPQYLSQCTQLYFMNFVIKSIKSENSWKLASFLTRTLTNIHEEVRKSFKNDRTSISDQSKSRRLPNSIRIPFGILPEKQPCLQIWIYPLSK